MFFALSILRIIGFVVSAILLTYGVWFVLAPADALAATYHKIDVLPFVMGGRYFFFGALLIAALIYDDRLALAVLLAGFAGLGFFDAVLYLNASPLPHFAVGVLCLVASVVFFKNRKIAS